SAKRPAWDSSRSQVPLSAAAPACVLRDLTNGHVRNVFFVLIADELQNVGSELKVHGLNRGGPGLGVGLWIVDGSGDFQGSGILAAEAFGHAQSIRGRAAFLRVQPCLSVQT